MGEAAEIWIPNHAAREITPGMAIGNVFGADVPGTRQRYVHADIADGYRAALRNARSVMQSVLDEDASDNEMEAAIGEIGEALAKGDEG